MGMFNGKRIENLEQSVKDIAGNKIKIECKILQPELLREKDVLVFTCSSKPELSATELLALKQRTEEFLDQMGIKNKVFYLNNTDLRVVKSFMQ